MVTQKKCLYFGYFYSISNEGWVSCVHCKKCVGVDSEDGEDILVKYRYHLKI